MHKVLNLVPVLVVGMGDANIKENKGTVCLYVHIVFQFLSFFKYAELFSLS